MKFKKRVEKIWDSYNIMLPFNDRETFIKQILKAHKEETGRAYARGLQDNKDVLEEELREIIEEITISPLYWRRIGNKDVGYIELEAVIEIIKKRLRGVVIKVQAIKWFVYITFIIWVIGAIDMMSTGDFDIYALWAMAAMASAVYYIYQTDNKGK